MTRGRISHIEINVGDLERSADFWHWFLTKIGYHAYQCWTHGKSWKIDNTYFVVKAVEVNFKCNEYHRKNIGLNHVSFYAADRQDVDEMKQALINRGISILYADRNPYAGGKDHYAVYFEDPDRIKVEFVAAS